MLYGTGGFLRMFGVLGLITFWAGCCLNLCFVVGLPLFSRWASVGLVCCVWLDSLVVPLLGLVACCPFVRVSCWLVSGKFALVWWYV